MKNPKISGDAEVNIQGRQDVHTNARWKIFTNVSHYENDLIAVLLKISGGGESLQPEITSVQRPSCIQW